MRQQAVAYIPISVMSEIPSKFGRDNLHPDTQAEGSSVWHEDVCDRAGSYRQWSSACQSRKSPAGKQSANTLGKPSSHGEDETKWHARQIYDSAPEHL